MPSFLIIERDEHTAERIRQALTRAGWRVLPVYDVDAALAVAEDAAPDVAFVEASLEQGQEVLRRFSRRNGESASVALVSDPTSPLQQAAMKAGDQVLHRPIADEALWAVVGLLGNSQQGETAAEEPAKHKLTSEEIFGDLLAEVESDPPAGGAEPSLAESPPATSPDVAPAEPPKRGPKRRDEGDDDLDRRLEQTLSGVLGPRRKKSPRTAPRRDPAASGLEDVDKMLSETLSGLELGARRKSRSKPRADLPPRSEPKPDAATGGGAGRSADDRPTTGRGGTAAEIPGLDMPGPDSAAEGPVPRPAELSVEPVDQWMAELEQEFGREPRREPEEPDASGASAVDQSADGVLEPVAEGELGGGFQTQEISAVGASAEPAPGRNFGQYRLLERIAVGGMAEVWKARMESVAGFQKTVAIKKILPQLTENQEFEKMFVDEAKLAAELNHPHITHIYDLGEIHGEYYIAMEYVDGRDLRSLLNRAQRLRLPIPRSLALLITQRLASALDYAHRKRDATGEEMGLVHRDVSPQNVLISHGGDIKLCDFGIVKAVSKSSKTQMGALKGKLQYMSPEQAWGQEVDARSDIFSLGAILFEMLTGERLFAGESELSVLDAVRNGQIRAPRDLDPEIPEAIDSLVRTAVAQEPDLRYQSADAMLEEIERVLAGLGLRPTTGELAAYLYRLENASEPVEAAPTAAGEPSPTASADGSAGPLIPATDTPPEPPLAAPGPSAEASGEEPPAEGPPEPMLIPVGPEPPIEPAIEDEPSEPSEPPFAADDDSGPLVDAVPPSEEELRDSGAHRRWLWLALLASLVLLAALAFYYVNFYRSPAPAGEGVSLAPASAGPPPASAPAEPEADEGTTGGGDAADAAGIPEQGVADPAIDDQSTSPLGELGERARRQLEAEQAAELARRQAELERQLEARERALREELERLAAANARQMEAAAESEPTGERRADEPPEEAEPPAATPRRPSADGDGVGIGSGVSARAESAGEPVAPGPGSEHADACLDRRTRVSCHRPLRAPSPLSRTEPEAGYGLP